MKKLLVVLIALAIWVNWTSIHNFIDPPELPAVAEGEVLVYSAEWCGYCTALKSFLAEKNIPFTELDIDKDSDAKRQFKSLGGRGIPLSVVNGEVIRGFNPDGILKALK
ncbi:glutaredoxin family protein [Porticoccaceae bacterium LTM1]|nr:glutaredoxin family protein [Porticoccaceae bacterium LTM1]